MNDDSADRREGEDRADAIEILMQIQKGAAERAGLPPIENLDSAARNPYEHRFWGPMVEHQLSEVHTTALALDLAIEPPPIGGTFRSRGIEVTKRETMLTPYSLILVNRGFFVFALLVAKVLAQCMPHVTGTQWQFSTDLNDIDERIANAPAIAERLRQALFAYIETGHLANAEPYKLGMPYSALADLYIPGSERFAIGHEYAHIAYERNLLGRLSLLEETVSGIDLASWRDELLADAIGAQLSIHSLARHYDGPMSLTGPYVLLNALELREKAVSVVRSGRPSDEISATHPPAAIRRQELTRRISQAVDDVDQLQHAEALTHAAERLWDVVLPSLEDAHAQGVRPVIA